MSETVVSSWPVFTLHQRRLLGVLVEKSKTTPDAYPLSVNALAVGSNQKSNRDPVLNITDDDVEETLHSLLPTGLVTRITGSRVERWRHNLYDVWKVDKLELAILAELLLRGPQTEGELRTHASRMDLIADLDILKQKLKPLQDRRLVLWLGDEGRRGSQITHGFHAPAELAALRQRANSADHLPTPISSPLPAPVAPPPSDHDKAELRAEMALLKSKLAALEQVVESMTRELATLKQSLGG